MAESIKWDRQQYEYCYLSFLRYFHVKNVSRLDNPSIRTSSREFSVAFLFCLFRRCDNDETASQMNDAQHSHLSMFKYSLFITSSNSDIACRNVADWSNSTLTSTQLKFMKFMGWTKIETIQITSGSIESTNGNNKIHSTHTHTQTQKTADECMDYRFQFWLLNILCDDTLTMLYVYVDIH